jgi:hypothetical protein
MIRSKKVDTDRVRVTFALPEKEISGRTSVVGDFNEWQPGRHELRRRANGTRSAWIEVPTGSTLRFKYLGEGDRWFTDEQVGQFDQHGNCVLTT